MQYLHSTFLPIPLDERFSANIDQSVDREVRHFSFHEGVRDTGVLREQSEKARRSTFSNRRNTNFNEGDRVFLVRVLFASSRVFLLHRLVDEIDIYPSKKRNRRSHVQICDICPNQCSKYIHPAIVPSSHLTKTESSVSIQFQFKIAFISRVWFWVLINLAVHQANKLLTVSFVPSVSGS